MNRRHWLRLVGCGLGMAALSPLTVGRTNTRLQKKIPSTGELLPAIGMGTWITFNIGQDAETITQRGEVLRSFFAHGGGMIDSSPMYGSAEQVLGKLLNDRSQIADLSGLFSATKVWTSSAEDGPAEIETSRKLWGVDQFDLLQVHNLLAWEPHLETLLDMKARGQLRYVGITTSHGRRHGELLHVMRNWPIDFVQATYNILDREVENEILPLANERGIAFIANRPYQRGSLINAVQQHPLPGWAAEFDAPHWPAFLLKFIISHPAVTCAIPATSQVSHMVENMSAMLGRQPDAIQRERMARYVASL